VIFQPQSETYRLPETENDDYSSGMGGTFHLSKQTYAMGSELQEGV